MWIQIASYALCAVVAAAPAAAFAQARSVEFADLVTALLVPVGAESNQPSWTSITHPSIHWKSTGPHPASAWLAEDGLPMSRTGTVVITVSGKPTHEHEGNLPGQWELTLAGTSAHPTEARIDIDKPAAIGFEPVEALRARGFAVKALCEPGGISSGAAVYTVEAPGFKPVTMSHEWSGGSAGTSVGVELAYASSRAATKQCE